jgi:class 3 adenylate cyclase
VPQEEEAEAAGSDDGAAEAAPRRTLLTATLAACQCALLSSARLRGYDAGNGVTLSLHMGVGTGEILAVHTGGVFNRWEFLVEGDTLDQISVAEPLAASGEVVVSPETWALVQHQAMGVPVERETV